MSTRASIFIDQGPCNRWLFNPCDGDPNGIGSDLVIQLRAYLSEKKPADDKWEADPIAEFIKERDMTYRDISSLAQDSEYIYVIDCAAKRLFCYKHSVFTPFDLDYPGDPLEIPNNSFDGRQKSQEASDKSSFSFDEMFESLPGLPFSPIQFRDTADGKTARIEIFNTALSGILEKWSISDITRNPDAEINYIVSIAKSLTDKALNALSK